MTIKEHIDEADRLMALAANRTGMNDVTLAHRDIALARAHLHAAGVMGDLEAHEQARQVTMDMKSTSAFMTDILGGVIPPRDGLA